MAFWRSLELKIETDKAKSQWRPLRDQKKNGPYFPVTNLHPELKVPEPIHLFGIPKKDATEPE